jgi:hypothetical protein
VINSISETSVTMSIPRNDVQALRRYGVELLPFIEYWRTRLVKGCISDESLSALIQPLQSDLLETQVFVEICRSLDAFLQRQSAITVEVISRHALLAMTVELCRRGMKAQVEQLVDKLCPT